MGSVSEGTKVLMILVAPFEQQLHGISSNWRLIGLNCSSSLMAAEQCSK